MPIITNDSLETQVSKNKFAPIYFLFGEEDLLIEEALESIVNATVDEATRSFNYDVLNSTDNSISGLVERINSYPIMATRRVVVMKDIEKFFPAKSKQDPNPLFLRYLQKPSEQTLLVITASNSDFLGKGKSAPRQPFDLIIEKANSIHFKKIYERDLPSWITVRIKKRGRDIAPEATEALISYAGSTLRVIDNEIEKLLTFVGIRKKITFEDIEQVVGSSRENNIFELQKMIGERKLEQASSIMENMLRLGESEQLIISMLSRYFSILWRLAELRQKTRDTAELGRALGISNFFMSEYIAAGNRFSYSEIKNAFTVLLKADVKLKSTSMDSNAIMQMMILSLLQGENYLVGI